MIDVSDPFKAPKEASFSPSEGDDKINAQWDIVYCDSDSLDNQPPKITLK